MESWSGFNIVHDPADVDEQAWSEFVLENERGNIFQTPEMYRVYLNTERYEPVFTAILNDNEEIMATMLGVRKEEPGFLARRLSNRVLVGGEPILSEQGDRTALLESLLMAHNEHVRKSAMFTEVRNVSPSIELQPHFEAAGYTYMPHLITYVDLSAGIESLWNGLKSKRRQGIRKAIKSGLTTCVLSLVDSDDLYMLLQELYRRIALPIPPKSLFDSVLSILQEKGLAWVVGVRHDEKLVSVVVNLLYKDVVYGWYAAGSPSYTKFHCNEYGFWTTFEWGVKNGFRLYDFGGGGQPGEQSGIRTFKERLGGNTRETGSYECVHQRLKHRLAGFGLKIWRAAHRS
jgi:lipid II:glycine glycyltransferase (peptidoglycan interpeptide bridge formation enzyme)